MYIYYNTAVILIFLTMSNTNPKLPFLEIFEWIEQDPNILMWKVPDEDREIKNGAKLVVRESQSAMLVNEGKLADVFGAGTHSLSTKNTPILSNILGFKYGFDSPYRADVYYFSTKQFVALKWGTTSPILMRDPQFGQVRLRAFGTYNMRIVDVAKFFREYAGTFPLLTVFEWENQIRDFIIAKFSEVIATSGISVVDMAGNLTALSEKISPLIEPYFLEFGIEVKNFTLVSVSLPDEVTKYFDTATNMNIIGDMDRFQKFNTAVAIEKEGTAVSGWVQDGAALGVMMGMMHEQMKSNASSATPQAPVDAKDRLQKLKSLFDDGLISEDEYNTKKSQILSEI